MLYPMLDLYIPKDYVQGLQRICWSMLAVHQHMHKIYRLNQPFSAQRAIRLFCAACCPLHVPFETFACSSSYNKADVSPWPITLHRLCIAGFFHAADCHVAYPRLAGISNVTFDQSTLRFQRWNWFTISNSSVYFHFRWAMCIRQH